jgi:hypothetical protein
MLAAQLSNLTALTETLCQEVSAINNNASLSNEMKVMMMPMQFEELFMGMKEMGIELFVDTVDDDDDNEGDDNYPQRGRGGRNGMGSRGRGPRH